MARRRKHEDHVNHEGWAIPYGDLVTLLLAFFVVMYAISSLNEGQYRVLAESLSEAFGGQPRVIQPIPVGEMAPRATPPAERAPPIQRQDSRGAMAIIAAGGFPQPASGIMQRDQPLADARQTIDRAALNRAERQLSEISERVVEALQAMIDLDQVRVRMSELWLEIEIKSDLLFASGVAAPESSARPVLESLAEALEAFPNPLRIEGHTDNVPIATFAFPSNWELSAARASSVARLFESRGIESGRLAVVGYGETRPVDSNAVPTGRDQNRRVVIVVLATDAGEFDGFSQTGGAGSAGGGDADTAEAR